MDSKGPGTIQKHSKPRPAQNGALGKSPRLKLSAEMCSVYQQRIHELQNMLADYREKCAILHSRMDTLRAEQGQWIEVFENTPAPYLVHDGSGYIQRMNHAASQLLEVSPGSRTKPCFVHFLAEEALLRWLEHMRQCARGGVVRTVELKLRVGPKANHDVKAVTCGRPASRRGAQKFYTVIFPADPKPGADVGAHAMYHGLVDMIEGIVWEADRDYTITFVSQYAERLLGFPVTVWAEPGFWVNRIYVQDRDRVLGELHRALSRGKEVRLDYRVMASDRRLVWLHDSITIVERQGRPKLLGVAIDVTEQRKAAEQLRQAHDLLEKRVEERTAELRRAVAELEAFSYSLSHDMRAPIRAMQGYVVLVRDLLGKDVPTRAGEFLDRIRQGAERLDMLVQDVLKFSRLGRPPLELKPVALEPVISAILHDYPALTPPEAQVEIVTPLPSVYGHEAFVSQALSNLLTNAVKFVPKGKTPQVRLGAEPAAKRPGDPAQWVRIWVEDNGLGIAPQDQPRIFRIFERVYAADQYEGTGMGLAIVQKAVQQLGGRVGVESSLGHGSRFWIELPRA